MEVDAIGEQRPRWTQSGQGSSSWEVDAVGEQR